MLLETNSGHNQHAILLRPNYRSDIRAMLGWRDYFQGAKRLASSAAESVYISRVYRGRSDNLYKFAKALVSEFGASTTMDRFALAGTSRAPRAA
jgi:hypothetical protein